MNEVEVKSKEKKKSLFSGSNFINKIKSIKHIEIYLVLLFLFILILIFMSTFKTKDDTTTTTSSFSVEYYSNMLEEKLEKVLSNVKDAGNVSVMVMVESGIEYVYATESEEVTNSNTISSGSSTKTTTTDSILTVSKNGTSTPVIVKENMPKVTGVIIVASGATSASVRLELLKAVQALLNVDSKNVEILVGN